MRAPSTNDRILPAAVSRGRYFMLQSVHAITSLASTNGSARRMRAATVAGDSSEYLDSDAVFGMKKSLIAQVEPHPPGKDREDERMDTPFLYGQLCH